MHPPRRLTSSEHFRPRGLDRLLGIVTGRGAPTTPLLEDVEACARLA